MNRRTKYFTYFGDREADARAFAADLPAGCRSDILAPDEDVDEWAVHVWGPWPSADEGEAVLGPLAASHAGELDGNEIGPIPVRR